MHKSLAAHPGGANCGGALEGKVAAMVEVLYDASSYRNSAWLDTQPGELHLPRVVLQLKPLQSEPLGGESTASKSGLTRPRQGAPHGGGGDGGEMGGTGGLGGRGGGAGRPAPGMYRALVASHSEAITKLLV